MQMASRRFYAYYIRGSQLALVEHDSVSGAGQTLSQPSLDDIGPSGGLQWKSPVASITDGIEIEYAYSPRYTFENPTFPNQTKIITPSWFINDSGYLTFTTYSNTLAYSPQQFGVDPFDQVVADEYFVITGSSKWNGLHKVQTINNNGWFSTYTKSSNFHNTGNLGADGGSELNSHAAGYIYADTNSGYYLNKILSVGDYVFIPDNSFGSGDGGHYTVTSITESDEADETSQLAYLGTKYFLNEEDDLDEFQSGDSHLGNELTGYGAKVKWDPCYINIGVNVLNNEFDTIDLPEYLAKGLVYYVKDKVADDQGDIEQKEYNMREFRRILEKHESSKIRGPRMMIPGGHGIR